MGEVSKTAHLQVVPQHYSLNVTISGNGAGIVESSNGLIHCPPSCSAGLEAGQVVTLTAIPDSGSTFAGWSGQAGCGGSGSCNVIMTSDQSVGATFTTP